MKLLTTLAATAAVCLTLMPEDASAQRRIGYYRYGPGVRVAAVGWVGPRWAYRPYYSYAARRPYWGYRYAYPAYSYAYAYPAYSYAAYRPYWGWGIGGAYAAAYTSVAVSPYYSYASYYPVGFGLGCGWRWGC
jgi:hypothetical protein